MALLGGWPASLAAQRVPDVQRVVLQGVSSIDPAIARRSIHTQGTSCRSPLLFPVCAMANATWAERRVKLDTAEVRRDEERLATLYEIWGFPDATVTHTLSAQRRNEVIVTFHVVEGQPIVVRTLRVRGADSIAGFTVPERLPLRPGEPYALPRLQAAESLLYAELARLGYPYARIEVAGQVQERERQADIIFDIQPGHPAVFGAVHIQTQRPLQAELIRQRLAWREGDPFSLDALERTERNLYALPIVSRVVAAPARSAGRDSVVDVQVRVDARRVQGFSGEALISSVDCAELRGFWQHRYLLGGPHLLALGARASNLFAAAADGGFPCNAAGTGEYARPQYGVEADLRVLSGRSSMITLRGFVERESAPDVYVQNGLGARLALARVFYNRLDAELAFQPERYRVTAADLYFCGQYGVCTATGLADLSGWNWQSTLEAVLQWRSTTVPPELRPPDLRPGRQWPAITVPVQRWNARAGFMVGGAFTGSDYTLRRGLIELTTTRLLGRDMEVAARTRAGFLSTHQVLPPRLLFFSGGPVTVRGVPQNLVGPKILATRVRPPDCTPCTPLTLVDPAAVTLRPTGGHRVLEGNIEVRRWVRSGLQLAAFLDAARIASSWHSADPHRIESAMTPGVGLRILTDMGPIRIDLGYDASGIRRYPLFLQENGDLVRLGDVRYDPFTYDRPSFLRETYRRLQLQLAIGQAF